MRTTSTPIFSEHSLTSKFGDFCALVAFNILETCRRFSNIIIERRMRVITNQIPHSELEDVKRREEKTQSSQNKVVN